MNFQLIDEYLNYITVEKGRLIIRSKHTVET
jgi:hypothetical protein